MNDKRKLINEIKLKGFQSVINKTANEVYIKKYAGDYFMGIVLSKSHNEIQVEFGLLDMPTFKKFLEVEGLQDMGIFNLTYSVLISGANEYDNFCEAIESFIAKFDEVLNDYISSSEKFLVPLFFTNDYRKRNNRIGIYLGLLRELATQNELSKGRIDSVYQLNANESNKNNMVDFKIDLLKKHVENSPIYTKQ